MMRKWDLKLFLNPNQKIEKVFNVIFVLWALLLKHHGMQHDEPNGFVQLKLL